MKSRLAAGMTLSMAAVLLWAARPAAAQTAHTGVVRVDTSKMLALPSHSHFSGANMQIFYVGTSYLDPKMQAMAQALDLGWVRFPAGTMDDIYDWKTGDMREDWLARFSPDEGGQAYKNFKKDMPIVRGKGMMKIDDYASFLATQRTGSGPGSSPTHTIGVINTFTDTPESAAELVLAAEKKNLKVDVWELGNEPVYFHKFYPTAKAYLDSVAPFAAAMKKADPKVRVAVFIDRQQDWLSGVASYPNRFWDEIYYHVYPQPPKNGAPDQILGFYNGFLANVSNAYVEGTLVPLFGKQMQVEISEFNIDAMRGGLYAAVFIAEYTLRMSSDPHITQMGMHTLVGRKGESDGAILPTDDHAQDAIDAYNAGKVADTLHADYGYYYAPDGLAMEIINGVINTSDGLWPTTVSGGGVVSMVAGRNGPPGAMPALYAQAYAGPGKIAHVLVTNKSGTAQSITIVEDGKPVNALLSTVSIGGSDPMAHNTPEAPDTVRLHRDTVTGVVTVPPYGVMDVSWRR